MHADPAFPDLPPGESASIRGKLFFFEGRLEADAFEGEFLLEEVNIDEDLALRDRYGDDVPVIFINGVKVFKHRVDPSEFKRKLYRLVRG